MGFIIVGDKERSGVGVIRYHPSFKKNIEGTQLQEICVPILINMCVHGDKKYVSYLSELAVLSNIL